MESAKLATLPYAFVDIVSCNFSSAFTELRFFGDSDFLVFGLDTGVYYGQTMMMMTYVNVVVHKAVWESAGSRSFCSLCCKRSNVKEESCPDHLRGDQVLTSPQLPTSIPWRGLHSSELTASATTFR